MSANRQNRTSAPPRMGWGVARAGAMAVAFLLLAVGSATGADPVQFATYGMPHDTVWGPVIDAFCKKHSCVHVDTDMSSAEAITKFLAEKNKPVAFATEAGILFGPTATKRGAALAYKNANWDKLPAWAKDPEGYWFAVYVGVPTFLVNPARVPTVPHRWSDLLKGKYTKGFGIKDPHTSGTALATVLAANAAAGGTLENLQPGIDYFRRLRDEGVLSPVKVSDSNIQKGEVLVTVKYDHENLILRDKFAKDLKLEVIVPQDGTIYTPSVLILNRFAPDEKLARAFADFVTSDEGQILLASAYPRPIRYIAGNLTVPADVKARWLPDSAYEGRVKQDFNWSAFSMDSFAQKWAKEAAP